MSLRWDPVKARANVEKHGVDFADTVGVFEDSRAMTIDDPHPAEQRFVTVGQDTLLRVLVVSWTARGDEIRVISARKATPRERADYEKQV